jgi:glycosyltransferase involved in cell wall biosynthesis
MSSLPLQGKRILVLVLHDMVLDTRVQKEGEVLSEAGAALLTLALHSSNLPRVEGSAGNMLVRIRLISKGWSRKRFVQGFKYIEYLVKATVRGVKFRPHAIHANDWDTLLTGWIIAKLCRASLVYDSHEYWWDSAVSSRYPAPLRRIQRYIERRFGSAADRLVSVSQTMLTAIQTRIPNPDGRIVYNSWLAPPPRETIGRGWDGKGPLKLLYLGALQPGRGLEALVKGVQNTSGVELDIYGYDRMEFNLHDKLETGTDGGGVRLFEPVPPEQVNEIASRYHMGTLPYGPDPKSRDLTLPNKLFEYAGAGLGLFSAPNQGLREWIDRFKAGIYFEADNVDSVERVLESILNNPQQVAGWQKGALEISAEVNSVTAETGIIDLYLELFSGND